MLSYFLGSCDDVTGGFHTKDDRKSHISQVQQTCLRRKEQSINHRQWDTAKTWLWGITYLIVLLFIQICRSMQLYTIPNTLCVWRVEWIIMYLIIYLNHVAQTFRFSMLTLENILLSNCFFLWRSKNKCFIKIKQNISAMFLTDIKQFSISCQWKRWMIFFCFHFFMC